MDRRRFIKSSFLASSSAVTILATSKPGFAAVAPKSILILGGTGYLGPAVVQAALIGGHKVTLFNRGITHPEIFPQLEKLKGLRAVDARKENLQSIEGQRRWDAVIDIWPCEPSIAASTAKLLKERTNHYLYVSSVGVYASYSQPNINEDAAIRLFNGNEEDYSPAKAESERRLRSLLERKLTIVRPGAIHGWGDGSPDMLSWLLRAQRGGTHIGPGDGSDAVQNVDVKDVARFLIMAIERQTFGTFNLTGHSMTFREYLAACNMATDSDAQWIWIPKEFLAKQGIADWNNFLGWQIDPASRGFAQISSERAFNSGWKTRPFKETALDILAYCRTPSSRIFDWHHPQIPWQDPLTPEKEQAVLNAWKSS